MRLTVETKITYVNIVNILCNIFLYCGGSVNWFVPQKSQKLFDWLDNLFFGFVRLNFLLCERQLLKSQQNLNWNSNVSVSALQNDIALHKKEILV